MPGSVRSRFDILVTLFCIPSLIVVLPTFLIYITFRFAESFLVTGFVILRRRSRSAGTMRRGLPESHYSRTPPTTGTPISRQGLANAGTGGRVPVAAAQHRTTTRSPLQGRRLPRYMFPARGSAIWGGERGVDILPPIAESDDPCDDMEGWFGSGDNNNEL